MSRYMKVSIEGMLCPLACQGCIYLFQLNRKLSLEAMLGPAHVDPPSPLMREHLGLRVIRLSFRGAEADMREYYTAKGTMYSLYIGDVHASID